MLGQGRTHRGDMARNLDEFVHIARRQLGGLIAGQRCQNGWFGLFEDRGDDCRSEAGPARDFDLVLDSGLDQQTDQIVLAQHGTERNDRARNFNVVERQDVDQGTGGPVGMGEPLGQEVPDAPLGLDHQAHENGTQKGLVTGDLHRLAAVGRVAQVHDRQQQAFSVRRLAAPGEIKQTFAAHRENHGRVPPF